MQVSIDQDRCCSSGQCVVTAPEVFEQDDHDGLVRLRVTVLPPVRFADVRLASELCPGGAITVAEDASDRDGEQTGPTTV
ncbi:ferredoxin [Kitasatospora sp. NPDC050463]|uniref:ferredoxin n=1 Tax=Kitasatospora sp. NPDC050463 TaxID=3155786 RepID=UPI0033EA8CE9